MNIRSQHTSGISRQGQRRAVRASRTTAGIVGVLAVAATAVGAASTQAHAAPAGPTTAPLLKSSNVSFTIAPTAAGSPQLSGSSAALGGTVLDHVLTTTGASSPEAQKARMSGLATQGRPVTINIGRGNGVWAEGIATVSAPRVEGAMPDGWVWFAKKEAGTWKVALEGDRSFNVLAAGSSTLTAAEREDFAGPAAGSSTNAATATTTGLQLPWAAGKYQTITQMPHNWSASSTAGPYSSIDVSGAMAPSTLRPPA